MPVWVALEYLASLHYSERGAWERARTTCWTMAQVNSTKRINPKKMMPLPWDEAPVVDEKKLERLKKKAKLKEKKINGRFSNKTFSK